ncbi:MAG: HigA family addiction module antitoxin [Candidatus Bipolaricaulota bacterium]|nr:HigA family addiction module antitoxin [Candidatus Bipolaricaulota bacterium]
MNTVKQYTFKPDYSVHPGEILGETLKARCISQAELASRCGISEKHISQIINGKASVTSETALLFERALGIRASLWMNLESSHRLHLARRAEEARFTSFYDWAKEFPLRSLTQRDWIPSTSSKEEKVGVLLEFFGVSSPAAWEAQYKKLAVAYPKSSAFTTPFKSIAAWLRIGELKAADIDTHTFNKTNFRRSLDKIRQLTSLNPSEFEPRMKKLCCEAGVALVFVPELPGTRVSGATMWVSPEKALIIQSLRYRKDDHFWFTFFHEAAHVLLHGKRAVFIDEELQDVSNEEAKADAFAANHLIPRARYNKFIRIQPISKRRVLSFAKELGIAPGIVVGRLQHDGLVPFSWFQDLKRTFVFAEDATS